MWEPHAANDSHDGLISFPTPLFLPDGREFHVAPDTFARGVSRGALQPSRVAEAKMSQQITGSSLSPEDPIGRFSSGRLAGHVFSENSEFRAPAVGDFTVPEGFPDGSFDSNSDFLPGSAVRSRTYRGILLPGSMTHRIKPDPIFSDGFALAAAPGRNYAV